MQALGTKKYAKLCDWHIFFNTLHTLSYTEQKPLNNTICYAMVVGEKLLYVCVL